MELTLPLDPSQPAGESEFSWGPGLQPHPDSNFQAGRLPFPEETPIDGDFWDEVAIRRSDSTVGDETVQDLKFAQGNPDRFGGQPPIVQESVKLPPAKFPTVTPKDRVTRED